MHIQVANIHAPYFLPACCPKWHLCPWTWPARHLEVIETAIESQKTATGCAGEFNAHLFESSAHAIRTDQRILSELFDFLHGLEVNFSDCCASMRLLFQSGKLLLSPPLERGMYGIQYFGRYRAMALSGYGLPLALIISISCSTSNGIWRNSTPSCSLSDVTIAYSAQGSARSSVSASNQW